MKKPLRNPHLALPTLAFQLAQSDSALKDIIVGALRQDATLVHKELLSQLQEWILTPLLQIDPGCRETLINP